MNKFGFIIGTFSLCFLAATSLADPSERADAAITVSQSTSSGRSESGVAEWAQFHLSYTISGPNLQPRETVSTGAVLTYHYTGELSGNTLTISGKGWGDVPVSAPNYPWVVSASVSVDGKTQEFEYKAITPGEKLNKSFSLSVPIPTNASRGSISMKVLYHSAYRIQGAAVTGTFTRNRGEAPAPAPTPPMKNDKAAADKSLDPNDSGCRFSGMTGQVEVLFPGADDWKLAKLDTVIPIGTHIKTQEDSSAILSFSDMSTFVLKPESEVVADSPPGPESKLKLVAGNIWANIKKMVLDGSMSIEMNQAVCGIKGTTFVCEGKNNGISTLKVIEGKVEFTAKADGKRIMVEGGYMVSADQKGLGILEKFDTAKETELMKQIESAIAAGSTPPNSWKAPTTPSSASACWTGRFTGLDISGYAMEINLVEKNGRVEGGYSYYHKGQGQNVVAVISDAVIEGDVLRGTWKQVKGIMGEGKFEWRWLPNEKCRVLEGTFDGTKYWLRMTRQ